MTAAISQLVHLFIAIPITVIALAILRVVLFSRVGR